MGFYSEFGERPKEGQEEMLWDRNPSLEEVGCPPASDEGAPAHRGRLGVDEVEAVGLEDGEVLAYDDLVGDAEGAGLGHH